VVCSIATRSIKSGIHLDYLLITGDCYTPTGRLGRVQLHLNTYLGNLTLVTGMVRVGLLAA
jgi:hypothetical protein